MPPLYGPKSRLQRLNYKYQPSNAAQLPLSLAWWMPAGLWSGSQPISHSDTRLWSQSRGKVHKNVRALNCGINAVTRFNGNLRCDRSRDTPSRSSRRAFWSPLSSDGSDGWDREQMTAVLPDFWRVTNARHDDWLTDHQSNSEEQVLLQSVTRYFMIYDLKKKCTTEVSSAHQILWTVIAIKWLAILKLTYYNELLQLIF